MVADHRDRERGIVRLVRAGQPRDGQVELAVDIAIMQPPLIERRVPILAARLDIGARAHRLARDRAHHADGIFLYDELHALLGDSRLQIGRAHV